MRLLDVAGRILTLHPAVLTSLILVGFYLPLATQIYAPSGVVRGVLVALPYVAMNAWIWAVFHVSNEALSRSKSIHWGWVFLAPPTVVLAAGSAGWSTDNSPSAFAFFIGLFVSITLAAKALEKAHHASGDPSVGRLLGTALLMYFAPIGLWVLRPRILRVAARVST